MLKALLFGLLAARTLCENCDPLPEIGVTVYPEVGEPENATASGKIQLDDDAFHLLVADVAIPRLCRGSVTIANELSVLQIVNASVREIDPGALDVAPTLALLKISRNPLSTVRKGVFNEVKAKEIDLSRNLISAIEAEAFDNNTSLQVVKLDHNAIKELNPDWFSGSPNVYSVDVIYNELTRVPAGAFKNFAKSRPLKLRLSANRITEIDEAGFRGAGDIAVLRLNGNKLAALPDGLFVGRKVANLQVNTNRLLCLTDAAFESGIRRLEFLENPTFNCGCLSKVRTFVDANQVDVMYPAIICEDRAREVNIVYNFNKTYEIPLPLP